tara:strand:- start:809 stop:970 length:162 start_codon:yes stop_codon:yes gene_type:complete
LANKRKLRLEIDKIKALVRLFKLVDYPVSLVTFAEIVKETRLRKFKRSAYYEK